MTLKIEIIATVLLDKRASKILVYQGNKKWGGVRWGREETGLKFIWDHNVT